jgi:hypothetical protein
MDQLAKIYVHLDNMEMIKIIFVYPAHHSVLLVLEQASIVKHVPQDIS